MTLTAQQQLGFVHGTIVDPRGAVIPGAPVQTLIDHIEGNATLEQFLDGFPSVSREQAIQFIELAKESLLACVSS